MSNRTRPNDLRLHDRNHLKFFKPFHRFHQEHPVMRRLIFEPFETDKRYLLAYQALCFADAPLEGRGELHAHGVLLGKLESVGTVANPDRRPEEPALYRCLSGGEVVISEVEYALLKRFLNAFINKVSRVLSRELEKALSWIDHVPEVADSVAGAKTTVENSVAG